MEAFKNEHLMNGELPDHLQVQATYVLLQADEVVLGHAALIGGQRMEGRLPIPAC